jgi:hypothetical protein
MSFSPPIFLGMVTGGKHGAEVLIEDAFCAIANKRERGPDSWLAEPSDVGDSQTDPFFYHRFPEMTWMNLGSPGFGTGLYCKNIYKKMISFMIHFPS